jgi:hypothetical protein
MVGPEPEPASECIKCSEGRHDNCLRSKGNFLQMFQRMGFPYISRPSNAILVGIIIVTHIFKLLCKDTIIPYILKFDS